MLAFVVTGFILCVDWLSKFYVRLSIAPGESVAVIDDFFYLTYLKNRGIIFGLFLPSSTSIIVAGAIIIVVVLFLSGRIFLRSRGQGISLGLLWGGLLANFFDRLWDGSVIDFLDLTLWPVFNIADTAICVGTIVLSIQILRNSYLSR